MKTPLSFIALAILFLATQAQAAVVAYYRFENNLNDSGTNSFNATSGTTGFSYSASVPGSEINPGSLSNTASYQRSGGSATTTTIAANSTFTNMFESSEWTVEAFVNLNAIGQGGHLGILGNRTAAGSGVYFRLGNSVQGTYSSIISFTNGAGLDSTVLFPASGAGLATNQWIHIAWVATENIVNGNKAIRFYINGTDTGNAGLAADTGGISMIMNSNDWTLGYSGNPLNGSFDELRISDTALTPAQFLSAVPEPATAALFLFGVGILGLRRKRKATV